MGPLTFNSQLYPHLKQTWSFSLLPPSSSPAYALSQNLKPRLMPSHGWLTLTTDMLDIHMLLDMLPTHTLVYTELDTTVTLLDTDTWERDPLTPKPSHGWPTPTTDMLDTHTLPPMVPMLTHLSTEPLTLPQLTPPMVLLTSSARDLLTPNQNPGMELTDTLPHTPMVDTDHTDTLLTVHTPTDVYMVPTTDTIEHVETIEK